MKCAYCGKNNKEGALYCKRCGIGLPVAPPKGPEADKAGSTALTDPLPESPFEPQAAPRPGTPADAANRKRAGKAKKQLIAVIGVLLLVAAGVLAIIIAASLKGEILPGGNSYTVKQDFGGYVNTPAVIYRGNLVLPEEGGIRYAASSLDGSTAGYITTGGVLYCTRDGKQFLVARYVTDFAVSVNGEHFIYRDENGMLWRCDCREPENAPVCICNDLVSDRFVVSPDGNSVVFCKQTDEAMYLYHDKKITAVADKLFPFAVSNGAKHIWAFSETENAYYHCDRHGNPTYIRSNPPSGPLPSVWFNSTHEEMCFTMNAGEGMYITMVCMKNAQPIEVMNADSVMYPVPTVSGIWMPRETGGFLSVTCPYKSFEGRVFAGAGLVRFSKNGSAVLEPNPCVTAFVSDDYRTLCYITNGELLRRRLGETGDPERIFSGVSDFRMAQNGSKLWFRSQSGTLVCVKGGNITAVAPDVGSFEISPNGNDALFMKDNFVCRNNGGNPNASSLFGEAPAYSIFADSNGLYALIGNEWKKVSSGGEKVTWELEQIGD